MISGFSKLSKVEKIDYLVENYFSGSKRVKSEIKAFWHDNPDSQRIFDEFSENTITNFYCPYGVVPNFLLNDKIHMVPMVIEESSVVAALSKAAKFWTSRGGFRAQVIDTEKLGQVHFMWKGETAKLQKFFDENYENILAHVTPLTKNMEKRGGGLKSMSLVDMTEHEDNYYQIKASFETCDAMGANFINSVLESIGSFLRENIPACDFFSDEEKDVQVVMCILSNYTPNCLVKAWVECGIEELYEPSHEMSAQEFVDKFTRAVRIAQIDVHRATTHNKGIFNGIDGVILATGNDFRAVEACGHTHAARDGQYRSLTKTHVYDGKFRFEIEIPMALGTVGGLTALHPLAKMSLDMLNNPSAKELMMITASVGLAQNFAAIRSLVTSGIQKGHMKMHLMNILNQLEATDNEKEIVRKEFEHKVVSFKAVRDLLESVRALQ
ncbi:hydroxymethylglutaryl-CoA reductase, degradative [Bacteriovorax sp. DB6_IX]|uniref:hydroxymethylglutaryl-CoA reductase, degradative n=1 Tax=Bacteriovorax sp. DB6_IX TaxID=1353530 RepID=UPI00054E7319|nr:hydroxymethylglutaryl-CoA reductase, degradative [Bacteriovorax sp. DB6_IX]